MPGFTVQYGSYVFTNNGRAHVTRQARYESDAVGAKPKRAVVTYGVSEWFLEDTFAANQAKYQAMLTAIRATPEGTLLIKDENGAQLVSTKARPQADNLPDQWGQHITECSIEFTATEIISNSTVDALVTWNVPVSGSATLKNVVGWREAIRTERPTFAINNRRESTGAVSASGRVMADPTADEATRRTFLQTERDTVLSIDKKQVTLAFGTFSKLVRIDNVTADIKDGSYELEWAVEASYRRFPTSTYTEAEYDVATRDDRERSERITTVRGKIRANTLSIAQTKLDSIATAYLIGNRTLRRNESSQQLMDGTDDIAINTADNYNELTFTLEYREPLDLVNWTLTLTDRVDARSGQLITTYSGRVTALIASNALAKARELGMGIYPVLLTSSEALTSSQIDDEQEQFVECVFSYEYARQGTLKYAEVQSESNQQTFSESTTVVSGFATASTEAGALALARSFKPTTGLQISARESSRKVSEVNGTTTTTLFTRVEFNYVFHASPDGGAIEYGEQTVKDYVSRETTITLSGTAIAETESEANALIDAVLAGQSGHILKDERTNNWAQAQSETILRTVTFSVTTVADLAANGDDILEAEMTFSTTYSVDHDVFTLIPFGNPFVQQNCGGTPAVVQVSGSIRALNIATARTWGRGKRSLATSGGYEDPPEERESTEFMPFSGTTVKAYRFAFTYSARFPSLILA